MGDSTFLCCAYCWKHEDSWDAILSYKCDICCKRVHYSCIKSPQPSILLGDTFFSFKCQACSENGKESFERTVISWLDVVILVLYNLHKAGQGMCGFYHWKSHICAFIDKHWNSLFGNLRKRTSLWMGTIAGTLSSGCPQFFESGSSTVEQGFWKLATLQPPLPQTERKVQREKRRAMEAPVELKSGQRRCRKAKESALSAAMELKEKRSLMQEGKKKRQRGHKKEDPSTLSSSFVTDDETGRAKPKPSKGKSSATSKSAASSTTGRSSESPALALLDSQDSMSSVSSSSAGLVSSLGEEADAATSASGTDLGGILTSIQMEDDSDLEIDVDIGAVSFVSGDLPDMRPMSPDISTMLNVGTGLVQGEMNSQSPSLPLTLAEVKVELTSDCESEGQSERDIEERSIKEEEASESEYSSDESEEEEGEEEEEDSGSLVSGSSSQVTEREKMEEGKKKKGRPRKRRREDDTPPPSPPVRLQRISLFEEDELLQKLNRLAEREALAPHMAQLRRKLICNQTNREYGLPVFDLEKAVNRGTKEETTNAFSALDSQLFSDMSRRSRATKETRDLDRFMIQGNKKRAGSRTYTSFRQRLVGLEDHELRPFVSPYTTRVLLPFIWRNYNPSHKPVRMRLLEEIVAYHNRHDPNWTPPPSAPIDFCYVRPEHIPSVNALCREFFWPGVDMSECLQYPDFSCVVMYKKIVIAFAFLVPDRGYNEAYISFVFTHPEWRGAGIATFMIYHLIQTCMGKDVVLHVSATNPAMFLYQKFGFKAEELILNFYYKYFPLNCKDSTNAFLMRLSR